MMCVLGSLWMQYFSVVIWGEFKGLYKVLRQWYNGRAEKKSDIELREQTNTELESITTFRPTYIVQ